MKLLEYQAKAIFSRHGIPVPRGELATTELEARQVASRLGGPVVIKPQLGIKGRGKVGGIGFAADPDEAAREAARLLGSQVRGERVETLLVEQRAEILQELYLSVAVDYGARLPLLMASLHGGVDIEEVARTRPNDLLRMHGSLVHPAEELDLSPVADMLGGPAAETMAKLYACFRELDAEMVEVNPLAITPDGPMAVDAVLNVDDAALPRHPDLLQLRQSLPVEDPLVEEAHAKRWTYIDLGGDIAILSSGAGLTMTILDLLERAGGRAANFLDTAQINAEGIFEAFDLLRRAGEPKVWLVNIFAGLNRCDRLAEGIRDYVREHPLEQPLIVRMVGNLEEEGHRILREAGVEPVTELEQAIERCVALSNKDEPQ